MESFICHINNLVLNQIKSRTNTSGFFYGIQIDLIQLKSGFKFIL